MNLGLLVVVAVTIQAQVRVEGIVVDTAGNPIGGAQLRMTGVQSPTNSRPDGTFAFSDVIPWGYTFSVQRAGFASLRDVSYIEATDQPVTGVRIVMTRQGVISGRVTSPSGDPIAGVGVSALEPSYDNGARTLATGGSAATDKNGQYRIAGLAPGSYFVRVAGIGSSAGRGPFSISVGPPQERPVETFYPSSAQEADAQRIVVTEGSELTGIDIQRREEIRYTIRGQLLDDTGQPLERMPMAIQPDGYTSARDAERVAALGIAKTTRIGDGGFEFRHLAPGRYWIVSSGPNPLRWERVAVNVTDSDVEGLIVRARASLDVTVTVQMENGAESMHGLEVALVETPMATSTFVKPTRPSEPLRFTRLPPGGYRLDIRNLPSHLYIKSIHLGDREVTRKVIDIRQPELLRVVLSEHAGQLQGTLRPDVRVILWPSEPRPEWAALGVWSVSTDQRGVFHFDGVPPGSYFLAAWETAPAFTDTYYDFVNRFRAAALPVEVAEDARLTLNAPLIPATRIIEEYEKLP